ncbi:MAG: hypothetical protein LBH07_08855 [Treponema sp.]|jgi:hypothetical protein|nr:hypothetical protein [Treponema sp.]
MLPVYFLSIALNALCGYILAFGTEETDPESLALSLNNETTRLILGGLSFITGILKILSPVAVEGNMPVVGDLFPALAGLTGGFILVFEFYRRRSGSLESLSENPRGIDRIGIFIKRFRKIFGFVSIAAAALHFIFYPVILL